MPLSFNSTPIALQQARPPELSRTIFAIASAISSFGVLKLMLKAMSGILAPIAVTPAEGWISAGPKSGIQSGCFIFSAIPSNCPLRRVARFRRSGLEADSS